MLGCLGPRVELDMLPVFMELAVLLPQQHLHIHMIGPDVPQQLHGTTCKLPADADHQQQGDTIHTTNNGGKDCVLSFVHNIVTCDNSCCVLHLASRKCHAA